MIFRLWKKWFLGVLFCALSGSAFAQNLGAIGTVYPIAETDFIQQMQDHFKQKDWAHWRTQQTEMLQAAADRPTPVSGLHPALHTHHWLMDPSFVVPVDIRNAHGQVLLAAGSRWNPLKHVHWTHTLIFFDGDNPQQVAWAIALDQQLQGNDRLILVNGSLQETARQFTKQQTLKKPHLYFDQGGRLTQRLQITQTPATVTQVGEWLEVTEVAV